MFFVLIFLSKHMLYDLGLKMHRQLLWIQWGQRTLGSLSQSLIVVAVVGALQSSTVKSTPEITRGLALPRTAQTHAALNHWPTLKKGFPGGASGKEPACQRRRHKGHGTDPWVGKIPWGRAWKPTPVFSPGESLEQRSLAGHCP